MAIAPRHRPGRSLKLWHSLAILGGDALRCGSAVAGVFRVDPVVVCGVGAQAGCGVRVGDQRGDRCGGNGVNGQVLGFNGSRLGGNGGS